MHWHRHIEFFCTIYLCILYFTYAIGTQQFLNIICLSFLSAVAVAFVPVVIVPSRSMDDYNHTDLTLTLWL